MLIPDVGAVVWGDSTGRIQASSKANGGRNLADPPISELRR